MFGGCGVGGRAALGMAAEAAGAADEGGEVLLEGIGDRPQPQTLRDGRNLGDVPGEEEDVPGGDDKVGADRVRYGGAAADGGEEDAAEAAQAGLRDGVAGSRRAGANLHADEEGALDRVPNPAPLAYSERASSATRTRGWQGGAATVECRPHATTPRRRACTARGLSAPRSSP